MVIRILIIIFSTFLFGFSANAGADKISDQCNIKPYKDARKVISDLNKIVTPNGVEESYAEEIGGIEQWITVRGKDKANPIILFVHGGPASPITPSQWQFQRPLEEYFTLITWDQRGAGKTYALNEPEKVEGTIHIQHYVDDAIQIAEHITKKYDKKKVILMGHSWGTIVGLHAALKRPDLFHSYIGVGQVINTRDNERLSFQYGLEQTKAHGNQEAVDEMMTIAPYPGNKPITRERIVLARKWSQYYGGLSAYRHDSSYFYKAARLSPEYSKKDICTINQGSIFTLEKIMPEFLAVDFYSENEISIPVIMFMGRHDYTTPTEPTVKWLNRVKAPYKKAVWFEHSSHMIPWEEPGKVLVSLLQYAKPLIK